MSCSYSRQPSGGSSDAYWLYASTMTSAARGYSSSVASRISMAARLPKHGLDGMPPLPRNHSVADDAVEGARRLDGGAAQEARDRIRRQRAQLAGEVVVD